MPKLLPTPSSARVGRWPGQRGPPLSGDHREKHSTLDPSPLAGKWKPPPGPVILYTPLLSTFPLPFLPSRSLSSSTHKVEEKPSNSIEVQVLDVRLSSLSFGRPLFFSLSPPSLLATTIVSNNSRISALRSPQIVPTRHNLIFKTYFKTLPIAWATGFHMLHSVPLISRKEHIWLLYFFFSLH